MNKIVPSTILFLLFFIVGCSDIFIDDITEKEITLRSPANGTELDDLTVTFYWDTLNDVEYYNLQVVAGTFDAIEEIYLDTNITTNRFTYYLDINNYEWQVCAFNSTGSTCSEIYSITIDSSVSIADQEITIKQPSATYINDSIVYFKWSAISLAENYRFEIRNDSWDDGDIYSSLITTNTNYNTYLPEGTYSFGLQAENQNIFTKFSTQNLIIDRTNPNKPSLSTPSDDKEISDSTITFEWSSSDGVALKIDSLFLSTSSSFTSSTTSSYGSTSKLIELTINTSDTYYWRVRSYDKASNKSSYSVTYSFDLSL